MAGLIYMDNHATTRVDPRVLNAMLPFFLEQYGNASSRSHRFGRQAEEAIEGARAKVAKSIGATSPNEIVFTSGATESINLAIKGAWTANNSNRDRVLLSRVEHEAVFAAAARIQDHGLRVDWLPVDQHGRASVSDARSVLTDRTLLVSLMLANNEVGTVQPVAEIAGLAKERGVLVHCDAAQGLGVVPFHVEDDHVDLASLSAHKAYGPKGVGALYVRRSRPRVRLEPVLDGGGQERGLRSGTPNVPGIVGFGEAAALLQEEGGQVARLERQLCGQLEQALTSELDGVSLNGPPVGTGRHPGNLNLSLGVTAESLIASLKDVVAVGTGSACASAQPWAASHVLRAMELGEARARSAIRFGIGRFNTPSEVEEVAQRVIDAVRKLRR